MNASTDTAAFGFAPKNQGEILTPATRLKDSERVIPLTRWNDYHTWPPQGGLRHLVFYANTNGFSRVIRRAGRRVLLHEGEFFRWLDGQNGGKE